MAIIKYKTVKIGQKGKTATNPPNLTLCGRNKFPIVAIADRYISGHFDKVLLAQGSSCY